MRKFIILLTLTPILYLTSCISEERYNNLYKETQALEAKINTLQNQLEESNDREGVLLKSHINLLKGDINAYKKYFEKYSTLNSPYQSNIEGVQKTINDALVNNRSVFAGTTEKDIQNDLNVLLESVSLQ
ncbi:MAG: hypothetical protein ACEPOV_06550 [Hyphomicrobiales bacterium]